MPISIISYIRDNCKHKNNSCKNLKNFKKKLTGCEHCNINRKRVKTVLLQDKDNNIIQECIAYENKDNKITVTERSITESQKVIDYFCNNNFNSFQTFQKELKISEKIFLMCISGMTF